VERVHNSELRCLPSSEVERLPSSEASVYQVLVERLLCFKLNRPPNSEVERLPSFEVERLPSSDMKRLVSSEMKCPTNSEVEGLVSSKMKRLRSSELDSLPPFELKRVRSPPFQHLPGFEHNRLPCCELERLCSSKVKRLVTLVRHCSVHPALTWNVCLVPRIHFHSRVHSCNFLWPVFLPRKKSNRFMTSLHCPYVCLHFIF
jgi:hypothetical protein